MQDLQPTELWANRWVLFSATKFLVIGYATMENWSTWVLQSCPLGTFCCTFLGIGDAFSFPAHPPRYLDNPLHTDSFHWDSVTFPLGLFGEHLNRLQWALPHDPHPLLWQTLGNPSASISFSRSSCFPSLPPKQQVSMSLWSLDFLQGDSGSSLLSPSDLFETFWMVPWTSICLGLKRKREKHHSPCPGPGVLVRYTAQTLQRSFSSQSSLQLQGLQVSLDQVLLFFPLGLGMSLRVPEKAPSQLLLWPLCTSVQVRVEGSYNCLVSVYFYFMLSFENTCLICTLALTYYIYCILMLLSKLSISHPVIPV